ncbi:fused MFS/spermidine synthase [Patescibacteria group bacterium]
MLMTLNKYILEISVFVCGAVVMVFEIVGSRAFAPYLGTSIFVWTSLIGVILGSLSVGYWLGGKIADKKATLIVLSTIIFLAAAGIGLTATIQKPLLVWFTQIYPLSIKCGSVLMSLVLFAPVSVLLGVVSPYAVKLKIENLDTTGSTVGSLYAISTVGSIVGTFLAGFFLIPVIGTMAIFTLLSATLIIVSLLLSVKQFCNEKKELSVKGF